MQKPAKEPREFSGDLAAWWDENAKGHEDLCRLLAIAALEGLDYHTIFRSAGELQRLMFPPKNAEGDPKPLPRFEATGAVIARLGAYRGVSSPESETVEIQQVIYFTDEEWRGSCLRAAWRDLEGLAPTLALWLVNLAAQGTRQQRNALAKTIALLFEEDPQGVFSSVVLKLSSMSAAQKWVAANALALVEREGARRAVGARLTEAAEMRHGAGAASVAALCVANAFGRRDPGEATRILLLLLESWGRLDDAIFVAMEGVVTLATGERDAARSVLGGLAEWGGWALLARDRAQGVGNLTNEMRELMEDRTSIATSDDALRHVNALVAASRARDRKPPDNALRAALAVAMVAAAAIEPPEPREEPKGRIGQQGQAQPKGNAIAKHAATDAAVAENAARLLLCIRRFPASEPTFWSLIRQLLRRTDNDESEGAIAILRALGKQATPDEIARLGEHLAIWQREPHVRATLERVVTGSKSK